ncbi:MAG TPA: ATP-binding protein [Pseudobdellovibrionaceae bacterium]|jgi:signal transduction histidine kinase
MIYTPGCLLNPQKEFEQLNFCLKTAHIGIWEASLSKTSLEFYSLKWDEQIRDMHGIPQAQEVAPLEWYCQNIHPDDKLFLRENVSLFLEKKHPSQTMTSVYRTRWPNGEIHSIEIYASFEDLGPNEDNLFLRGIAKDITQDIQKQKLLEDQKNYILTASRMALLADISAGIAHEINNPLTVIQARSFQLTQMVDHGNLDPVKIKSAAESISKTGDKIAKIIQSLRSFAREKETEPLDTLNVAQLIQETLDFCKVRFYKHGIDIRLGDIPENLEFECHLLQIEEALLNIFNNAHDAISKLQEKWILIEAFDKETNIEIHVTDSGNGIADDIADKIMLPFFTTKKIDKGIGLGLSITAEIINKHHGTFFLDRTADHTKFLIRIPKVQPAE